MAVEGKVGGGESVETEANSFSNDRDGESAGFLWRGRAVGVAGHAGSAREGFVVME